MPFPEATLSGCAESKTLYMLISPVFQNPE